MRFGIAPLCHAQTLTPEAPASSPPLRKRCNAKAHGTLRVLLTMFGPQTESEENGVNGGYE
jgi:hypothetical protein